MQAVWNAFVVSGPSLQHAGVIRGRHYCSLFRGISESLPGNLQFTAGYFGCIHRWCAAGG